MDGGEFIASQVWSELYKECWEMWKVGLDKLRKAANGVEAAHAKQQMEDAERLLKLPFRLSMSKDQRSGYESKLARVEEQELKKAFEDGVRG